MIKFKAYMPGTKVRFETGQAGVISAINIVGENTFNYEVLYFDNNNMYQSIALWPNMILPVDNYKIIVLEFVEELQKTSAIVPTTKKEEWK